jgi:hypothetical protein
VVERNVPSANTNKSLSAAGEKAADLFCLMKRMNLDENFRAKQDCVAASRIETLSDSQNLRVDEVVGSPSIQTFDALREFFTLCISFLPDSSAPKNKWHDFVCGIR